MSVASSQEQWLTEQHVHEIDDAEEQGTARPGSLDWSGAWPAGA